MTTNKIKKLLKDPLIVASYFVFLIGFAVFIAAWNTWKISHQIIEMGVIYEYGLIYGFCFALAALMFVLLIVLKIRKTNRSKD